MAANVGKQAVEQRFLAAEQVGAAADIEPQCVRAADRDPGRKPQSPIGQRLKRVHRRYGRGRCGGEAWQQGSRVGQRHARSQPGRFGRARGRRQTLGPGRHHHQRERLSRRGGGLRAPLRDVGLPMG